MRIGVIQCLGKRGAVDGEARRLANREFNLSTTNVLPQANEVVQGEWFRDAPGVAEASVEQSIMERLGLKLGDTMRFDMAGLLVDAKITSVRKLEWGSMRANFFVIINPAAMAESVREELTRQLDMLKSLETDKLLARRYERLMSYGV